MFEENLFASIEILLELQDIPVIGAAPAVDRLVFVADGEEGAVDRRELAEELVLGGVGVLKFVDENLLKAFPVPFADVRMILQEPVRIQEHVVEVDGVAETERFLIFFVDAGDDLAAVIAARHVLREEEVILGVGDFVMDRLRPVEFIVDI